MRLIDADELLKEIDETAIEVENARSGETIKKAFLQCLAFVRENVIKKPTAYDADKVMEQMKDHALEFEAFGQCSDYVELTHAIEIVRVGGVNANITN